MDARDDLTPGTSGDPDDGSGADGAGPEGADAGAAQRADDAATRRWIAYAGAALAVVVALCAGLLVGNEVGGGHPSDGSVDAGFARDMQAHHAQAVDMSFAVRDASDDETVDTIAYDIITTQQAQIGRMSGWLDQWDLPAYSSEPVMSWMGSSDGGHAHGDEAEHGHTEEGSDGALMTGMATDAEMDALREASGLEAEILYLQLMIDHHRGGIEMAQYAADHAEDEAVVSLAAKMAVGQQSEIDLMNDMLVQRGAEPV